MNNEHVLIIFYQSTIEKHQCASHRKKRIDDDKEEEEKGEENNRRRCRDLTCPRVLSAVWLLLLLLASDKVTYIYIYRKRKTHQSSTACKANAYYSLHPTTSVQFTHTIWIERKRYLINRDRQKKTKGHNDVLSSFNRKRRGKKKIKSCRS